MYKVISLVLLPVVMLGMAPAAYGALSGLPKQDVGGSWYDYDMSAAPSGADLDTNSTLDWVEHISGAASITYLDGIATFTTNGNSDGAWYGGGAYGGGTASNIWPAHIGTGSYTVEFSMQSMSKDGWNGHTGDNGYLNQFGIVANTGANALRQTLMVGAGQVRVDLTGDVPTVVDTNDNTDQLHIFRMAWDSSPNDIYLWRDGAYLGMYKADNTGGSGNGMGFGGLSDAVGGVADIGYLAITPGAYAPVNEVPEPSTVVLLVSAVAGLLAYAWRRRR